MVEQAGGRTRVLVLDSLSDGYGLGATAPRLLADQLCKLAVERGLILVLLEETLDSRPSPWSFASDVVLELEVPAGAHGQEAPEDFDRRVMVRKNRFGPSDAGPHPFEIHPAQGVVLFPRPSAYLSRWAGAVVAALMDPQQAFEQAWSIPLPRAQEWPPFRNCVTAVFGADAALVRHIVEKLGAPMAAVDMIVDFNLGRVSPSNPICLAFQRTPSIHMSAEPA